MRQKQRDEEEEEEETGRDRQREREGGGRSAEVWVKRLSESDRGGKEKVREDTSPRKGACPFANLPLLINPSRHTRLQVAHNHAAAAVACKEVINPPRPPFPPIPSHRRL